MATRKRAAARGASVQLALNTARLDRMEPVLEKINERLDSIEQSIQRNKGFWGAVTTIGAAVTAMLTIFKDELVGWFSRG